MRRKLYIGLAQLGLFCCSQALIPTVFAHMLALMQAQFECGFPFVAQATHVSILLTLISTTDQLHQDGATFCAFDRYALWLFVFA